MPYETSRILNDYGQLSVSELARLANQGAASGAFLPGSGNYIYSADTGEAFSTEGDLPATIINNVTTDVTNVTNNTLVTNINNVTNQTFIYTFDTSILVIFTGGVTFNINPVTFNVITTFNSQVTFNSLVVFVGPVIYSVLYLVLGTPNSQGATLTVDNIDLRSCSKVRINGLQPLRILSAKWAVMTTAAGQLVAADGQEVQIENLGAFNITLAHAAVQGTVAGTAIIGGAFYFPQIVDLVLAPATPTPNFSPGDSVLIQYDDGITSKRPQPATWPAGYAPGWRGKMTSVLNWSAPVPITGGVADWWHFWIIPGRYYWPNLATTTSSTSLSVPAINFIQLLPYYVGRSAALDDIAMYANNPGSLVPDVLRLGLYANTNTHPTFTGAFPGALLYDSGDISGPPSATPGSFSSLNAANPLSVTWPNGRPMQPGQLYWLCFFTKNTGGNGGFATKLGSTALSVMPFLGYDSISQSAGGAATSAVCYRTKNLVYGALPATFPQDGTVVVDYATTSLNPDTDAIYQILVRYKSVAAWPPAGFPAP